MEVSTSQVLLVSEMSLHVVCNVYLLKKHFISWEAAAGGAPWLGGVPSRVPHWVPRAAVGAPRSWAVWQSPCCWAGWAPERALRARPRGQLPARESGQSLPPQGFSLCLWCSSTPDTCFPAHPWLRKRTKIWPYLQNKDWCRVICRSFQTTDNNIFHLLSALKSSMVSILCITSNVFASV